MIWRHHLVLARDPLTSCIGAWCHRAQSAYVCSWWHFVSVVQFEDDEVTTLRQRLVEKTGEVDSVRRELDRALIQLREKEAQLLSAEGLASRRGQVFSSLFIISFSCLYRSSAACRAALILSLLRMHHSKANFKSERRHLNLCVSRWHTWRHGLHRAVQVFVSSSSQPAIPASRS
jgi:hypothetical protein